MFSPAYLILIVLLLVLLAGSQWLLRHKGRGVRPAVHLIERRPLTTHTVLLRASCNGQEIWLLESTRQITLLTPAPAAVDVPGVVATAPVPHGVVVSPV